MLDILLNLFVALIVENIEIDENEKKIIQLKNHLKLKQLEYDSSIFSSFLLLIRWFSDSDYLPDSQSEYSCDSLHITHTFSLAS